jgi:hypothetical protein
MAGAHTGAGLRTLNVNRFPVSAFSTVKSAFPAKVEWQRVFYMVRGVH